MKNKFRKLTAIILALAMVFSLSTVSYAADGENAGEPYSLFAHVVDGFFGILHDVIFGTVEHLSAMKDVVEFDEFIEQNDIYFNGTDGQVRGDGWSGGFAKDSVIPEQWRINADNQPDPNGYCLTRPSRVTGGYQGWVNKIYTDQFMNMIILSNGSDSNNNGIDDMIIFVSVDGVGITAGSVKTMREEALKALSSYGVVKDDILTFNISATHCHGALDTQGMAIHMILLKLANVFFKVFDNRRILGKEMQESLNESAFNCAKAAYKNMSDGKLSFFETEKVDYTHDKNNSGVKNKNTFSCFLFEGNNGQKTILSNIAAHPTGYTDADSTHMMCADYPYHMAMALKDEGYNIVFTQSAQASISSPGVECDENSQLQKDAEAWMNKYALTKDQWAERYGQKYADKYYDPLESYLENDLKEGYKLAHVILDGVDSAVEVAPVLNVKNSQHLLPLDNGLLGLGSISGLLGENVVKMKDSESGYGAVVEVNYIEIGNDVAIFTAPGELSPSLVYGTDPNYDGTALWNGKTSWTGETWGYDTLENLVREYTGDEDKNVLLYGITNDALGYMYPDICTPKSLLGTLFFYKENPDGFLNDMLLTTGQRAGSTMMNSFIDVLEELY